MSEGKQKSFEKNPPAESPIVKKNGENSRNSSLEEAYHERKKYMNTSCFSIFLESLNDV